MISPPRAMRLIARHTTALGTERVALDRSLGRALARDVRAPFPLPRFDNSAMDGFAVRASDTSGARPGRPVRLVVADTIHAGATAGTLHAAQTYRIMTGAPLPRGADTVIPVERATLAAGALVCEAPVPKFQHVRRRGEEMRSGARILRAGMEIHPGVIACLAAVGMSRVPVVRAPRVAVITTGDETVLPGTHIGGSRIYDSNSAMLTAMLRQAGIEPVRVRRVGDRRAALKSAVRAALGQCDVLVSAGGVSMGERDFLRPVLDELGVNEVFWRVRQKPGKPLYFGTRGRTLVFGLPGNPASCFTCFYAYVYAALRRLGGFGRYGDLERETGPADGAVVPGSLWQLLRARAGNGPDGAARCLSRQGSHMVSSLAEADRLVVVPPGPGDAPDTMRLPHAREKRR